jgi:hypothetical protein
VKKHILGLSLVLAGAISALGGGAEKDRALMARMGFSKEEIAKDAAAHNAVTGTLDATGGKSDPKEAALMLRDANEINKLRVSRVVS